MNQRKISIIKKISGSIAAALNTEPRDLSTTVPKSPLIQHDLTTRRIAFKFIILIFN
jgi:hypothetical protein